MWIVENIIDTVFSFLVLHTRFAASVIESYLKMIYRWLNSLFILWFPEPPEDDEEVPPPPPKDGGSFDLHQKEEGGNWFF